MYTKKTLTMKPGAVAAILSIFGLITLVPTWAWWNAKGPFQEQRPSTSINLLANVKYIDVHISFDRFADFRQSQRIVIENGGHPVLPSVGGGWQGIITSPGAVLSPPSEQPEWLKGEKVPSLRPFLRDGDTSGFYNSSRTKKEMGEMLKIEQGLTITLSNTVRAEGLHLLPFQTADRASVSETACAIMDSSIRTYHSNRVVHFQVETSIYGVVCAQFTNPALLHVELGSSSSPQYAVHEKYAVQAINSALRENATSAIRNARLKVANRLDRRRQLRPDPEEESAYKSEL